VKIYHFYHIWADGNWEIPVKEHLDSLIKYEILNSISIKIGIVGSVENRDKVKKYVSDYGINFEVCAETETGYEQETLDKILELEDEDAYILYMHTKGSYNDQDFEHNWRRNMTLGLIGSWQKCIQILNKNVLIGYTYSNLKKFDEKNLSIIYNKYDEIFSNKDDVIFIGSRVKNGGGTIGGNFWWSRLKYLKLLKKPNRGDWQGQVFSDGSYLRGGAEEWVRGLNVVVKDQDFSVYSISNFVVPEPQNQSVVDYSLEDILKELPKRDMCQIHFSFINLYEKYKNRLVHVTSEEFLITSKNWNTNIIYDKIILFNDDSIYRRFYDE
jgi:hypothetical protein